MVAGLLARLSPALVRAVAPHRASFIREQTIRCGVRMSSSAADYNADVEAINALFSEAREEIEYAKEEAETVYFNESVAEARRVTEACLARWDALVARLPDDERSKLQRSMGLKMEQLKAEFDLVAKLHLEE
ncbi:hypothetical protein V8C86DRAFT_3128282 [Haematococcus lacustris]